MQWACTSTVLTRLPATTTSRRPCACGCPPPPPAAALAPAVISHPTKAMVAGKSPLIGISIPLLDDPSIVLGISAYYGMPAQSRLFARSVCRRRHKAVINRRVTCAADELGDRQCNFGIAHWRRL